MIVMRIVDRAPSRPRPYVAAFLVLLIGVPSLAMTAAYIEAFHRVPTRQLASRWIESHIPPGARIVQSIDHLHPVLAPCESRHLHDMKAPPPCYEIANVPLDLQDDDYPAALDRLRAEHYAWLIYTDATPPLTRARLHARQSLLNALEGHYPEVATFAYDDLQGFADDTATVAPEIRIYRLIP